MRNKLGLKNNAILIALFAVTVFIGFYSITNRTTKNAGVNGGISLKAPLFISEAKADESGITAFPEDQAGMSAYVKVEKTIDLDKVRSIFTKVVDVGDNYINGIFSFSNKTRYGVRSSEIHLYADTEGWIVAYLMNEEPVANIMKWPEEYDYSPITKITNTTLQETLYNAGQAAKVKILLDDIKYYHFNFPEANAMTLFVKLAVYRSREKEIIQVKIPPNWSLYEASYTCLGFLNTLKVNDKNICSHRDKTKFGSYGSAIYEGVLHTIEIQCRPWNWNASQSGATSVVTGIVYRTAD